MKIKDFCTPLKILTLIFMFFVSFLFSPALVYPKSQLTECDIRPHLYSVATGDRLSGDLNSVYEHDGDTLSIRSSWVWFGIYFEFYVDIFFYFDPVQCDELYFDFFSINNALEDVVVVWIYYTDDTYERTTSIGGGAHTVGLDERKYIDKVWVQFIDRSYVVTGGDRYLFVDLIAVKPVGDNTPPIVIIDYQDGDGTDVNPGIWNVSAHESGASVNENSISVWIDGQLAGSTLGEYDVPKTLGTHTIYVEVENNNGCPTTRSESVTIIDDDTTGPTISYVYTGDGTDKNSGKIVISAMDESGLFDDPSGTYSVPNTLGVHDFVISATDNDNDRSNDRLTSTAHISIEIIDDDNTPPEIDIQYIGSGLDDHPGYFEWSVSDIDSGISEINLSVSHESTEGLDDYTINFYGNETGSWNLPFNLGNYTIEISARDNDDDRLDDSLTKTMVISNGVIDDDNTPPEIDIQYIGSGLDDSPGYFEWTVYDLDSALSEINVTITYESTEGLDDCSIPLIGAEAGTWNLLPNLGCYTIEISARDNDDDRTLIVDSLTTELLRDQVILDDDNQSPELANLIIVPEIYEINVSFDAFDISGVGDISILIDGENVEPLTQIQDGNTYSFIFQNQWLFESQMHEVIIQVKDGDNDRLNDALTSSINGTFENIFYQMHEYIIWQIEQLKNYNTENLYNCTALYLNRKLTRAQDHLYEALSYYVNGNITCDLYHDAMAKVMIQITEFKVELLNKYDRIKDEHAEYIVNTLHEIRNNIVILMGVSSGSEQGVKLAQIEVDLLNLRDLIENEIDWGEGLCLYIFLRSATCMLEGAIFKISMNIDIECMLSYIMWKLDIAACLTKCLLERGTITQELADFLLDRITQAQAELELVQNSL
ncbi:MAG: hypothetical protein KGD70_07505 [Candidatus Lokiarchaeota archaeon]|nr:hypothetical protein [Candidatus Lokiarchaeota archaeon]